MIRFVVHFKKFVSGATVVGIKEFNVKSMTLIDIVHTVIQRVIRQWTVIVFGVDISTREAKRYAFKLPFIIQKLKRYTTTL